MSREPKKTNLTPTRATALVRDGKIVSVIHVGSTHMEFDATNTVPCLIIPASVPIAECPLEWKVNCAKCIAELKEKGIEA